MRKRIVSFAAALSLLAALAGPGRHAYAKPITSTTTCIAVVTGSNGSSSSYTYSVSTSTASQINNTTHSFVGPDGVTYTVHVSCQL